MVPNDPLLLCSEIHNSGFAMSNYTTLWPLCILELRNFKTFRALAIIYNTKIVDIIKNIGNAVLKMRLFMENFCENILFLINR